MCPNPNLVYTQKSETNNTFESKHNKLKILTGAKLTSLAEELNNVWFYCETTLASGQSGTSRFQVQFPEHLALLAPSIVQCLRSNSLISNVRTSTLKVYWFISIYFFLIQDLSAVLQYLTAVFVTGWREVALSDDQESANIADEVGPSTRNYVQKTAGGDLAVFLKGN